MPGQLLEPAKAVGFTKHLHTIYLYTSPTSRHDMADVEAADTAPAVGWEDLSQPAPEAVDGTLTTTNTAPEVAAHADGTVEKVKRKKIIKRKRRPARPQQDPATFKSEPPPQTGTIFNIW